MPPPTRTTRKWKSPRRKLDLEAELCSQLGISSLTAATLVARGMTAPETAAKFLSPAADQLHDPRLLPDALSAVSHIMHAKENDHPIYVHGDYDVDGVTSAAIWTRTLRRLGFKVIPHVPHRIKEGYGIHVDAVQQAANAGAKLFLTCDCGSSAHASIEAAKELGMTVVVTDHHELPEKLPAAEAIVNPHRKDSEYPFKSLSGAGVAFKIAQLVSEECGASLELFHRAFLDLACLGTIADVVPLVDENRVIASLGLKQLSNTKKAGLRALISTSGIGNGKPITSFDVGWRLGPRLNAAGRIADAEESLSLLLTEDAIEANGIAAQLEVHNSERKTEQNRILEHAEEIIKDRSFFSDPLIFISAPEWHVGVIGIVAGRLAERYYRPVLVASENEDTGIAKGSARSIPGFNLFEALRANGELFEAFGGHERAAGFSINAARIEEAREQLIQYADGHLTQEVLTPTIIADAEIGVEEVNLATVEELQKLEPFGEANPVPRFIMNRARVANASPTKNPEHAQFEIESQSVLRGIAFKIGNDLMKTHFPADLNLLVELNVDEWNGYKRVNVQLKDFN